MRRLSRILMLMIGAFLSACGTQTERGSSGPGSQGRTVAAAAKPQAKPQQQAKVQEQAAAPAPEQQAAAAAPEPSVPEFVSEPEPAGMVPVPPSDSFAPESSDDLVSAPTMAYDEEPGAPREEGIVAESRYHEEEEGAAKDDGIIAQSVYGEDESGVAQEEGITGQSMYYEEEEGAPKEEGIIAQSQYYEEEEGAANDDGIIAQSQYHEEEEGAAKDEGIIAESQYYEEEEGAAKDDGIIGQSQYHEEEEGAAKSDDILAHNIYGEDDSGHNPENLVSEPKTFTEEKLAQAEEPKAAPVTMLPVTITVEAEPLFDFDKYAVRPESRKKLDDLVEKLKSVTYGDVIVVGFTDPIGTAMYNQKLSERRAASVKRYLMGKGIPADKIKNEGRGETEEYASYQSCGGMRKAKLIACLQPDRRVEVTVTAQKQQ